MGEFFYLFLTRTGFAVRLVEKMKKTGFLLLSFCLSFPFAQVPLPSAPDWMSLDRDYSTGGSFADVNGDGYLDFLISNGNDMAYDRNAVYLNNTGVLETNASWRSIDSGLFGHCYSGDVNNDGLPDFAVAYLGYFMTGELKVRLYLNSDSGLEPQPFWVAADRHSSFDCCLGDVDLDGDLDLAISAGDAYTNNYDRARIYQNNGGVFDSLPFWAATDSVPSDAIRFCDIDNDGDLDLFVGQRRKVSMYRNNDGVLETNPSWVGRQGVGWVLRLDFGDYDQDGFFDLAVASNDQLGDPNSIKVFHNDNGTLDTIATFNMQRRGTNLYSSCVAWGDVNGDGYLDLAAGGWWRPAVVYLNNAGVLETLPSWSWSPPNPQRLVCEALIWTDVDNSHLSEVVEAHNGDGRRKLFYLHRRPVQFWDSVKVNGERKGYQDFCFDPLAGWVSFAQAPDSGTGNVVFYYRYSDHPDLAVTNWDTLGGNLVFLNTTPAGISAAIPPKVYRHFRVSPNPSAGLMYLSFSRGEIEPMMAGIYAQDGRLVRKINLKGAGFVWDGRDEQGEVLPQGVYVLKADGFAPAKLIRVKAR